MELIRYEEVEDTTTLSLRQARTRLTATRSPNGVRFSIAAQAGRGDCDRVEASLEICFSCEEYERLLCELHRLECGAGGSCDPEPEVACCDDEPILVPVRELRKAMRGCGPDDLIEISE